MKRLAKLNEIKPNPNNPRVIKDDKFKKLVESLVLFPKMLEKRPIVVDENMVILGGNMRFRAAKEAGLKEVWIDVADDWTDDEKQQFIIKDNASGGEWDWDMLANGWEIENLADWGLDLPSFIENMGVVDHFRDQDGNKLDPSEDYEARTSNTLILIFDDIEYKFVIEKIKELMKKGYGDTPSQVILQHLRNENL
jgi:hypothetical protein